MALRLGDTAPDFRQVSTEGVIRFYEWAGENWVVLFSHPKDFTPVCTTELGEVARLQPEFARRGVRVLGLSVDPFERHAEWARDIEQTQGHALNFPLVADYDRSVSDSYGMIHPATDDTMTVRSVFVIDPARTIRLMLTYPASTGRCFDEILRAIDSLQLTDRHEVATPVNWKDGDDVFISPALSDDEAKARFPGGWSAPRPYLRLTRQPGRTGGS